MSTTADRLTTLFTDTLGVELPVRIRAWDGSEAGPPDAPVLALRKRRALRRLLWRPDELGLGRAWVSGDLDVEGDLYDALHRFDRLAAQLSDVKVPVREVLKAAVGLRLAGPPPRPPAEEARAVAGAGSRHSKARDAAAISHHYDVGNRFYELVLGPSMTYSCAYWGADRRPGDLAAAQAAKFDLVCRKLDLKPGQRLLDVGCGWGSMAVHAAREYGVSVTGVTLSKEQAAYGRKRVAEEGLAERVDIRVQDYRDVADGPYDAVSSIGMAEHVGASQYRVYCADLFRLLRPQGRLLNHQIARRPDHRGGNGKREPYHLNKFIAGYVFPDGELAPLAGTAALLEEAGFEVRDVQALREHYALTLREWVANLREHWDEAVRLTSPGRARVWHLYMAASAVSFETNRLGVNQVLAVRPDASGASAMPLVRNY
ncbi:cyclopropane-fatty-acyl-phospholipid synthase [Mangrovactinospora gilvigrisea]|uniref:Cyclopropane-fatty-acyl-phospholipid synthase n=1 Tax=Mangrovactinospora gilvigrisea TaxID=1428644 RepID=A0A1J7BJM3_9ACTN|nr:class I SAM-dependent methyltransferase [Mangrovactinospora gilvigrisea]OIV38846.1 cyclopropane-fatty-acyl-phospholipid synthase [Mangrovactinospora gilvigrisea]